MRGGRVAWRRGRLGAWAAAGKIGNFGSRGLRAKGTQEGEVKREVNRVFQPRGLLMSGMILAVRNRVCWSFPLSIERNLFRE